MYWSNQTFETDIIVDKPKLCMYVPQLLQLQYFIITALLIHQYAIQPIESSNLIHRVVTFAWTYVRKVNNLEKYMPTKNWHGQSRFFIGFI